jgi:hypothetical protein
VFSFVLQFWKPIAIAVLIGVVFFGVKHAKSKYDAGQQEIGAKPYKDAIEHQKQEARELLAAETAKIKAVEKERDARIATLEREANERTKADSDFKRRVAATGRLRDSEARCGNGGSGPASTEAKVTGTPEGTGGGNELSETLSRLLKNLMVDTQTTIRQYEFCQAYAVELSSP